MKRSARKAPDAAPEAGESKPMDITMRESKDRPVIGTNHPRNCWALDTLIAEVKAIDPGVSVETDNADYTNACLDGMFTGCNPTLIEALDLLGEDPRLIHAISGGDDMADSFYVSFSPVATVKDSREPFHLAQTMDVLAEDEG